MGGAWWKLSGGNGRCEDVRVGRCVRSRFVLPHGRVCFGQGESPVKLFAKLFGRSPPEDGGGSNRPPAARHGGNEDPGGERPLFRDQPGGQGGDIPRGRG